MQNVKVISGKYEEDETCLTVMEKEESGRCEK
jgi:hypothetical protein